MLSDTLSRSPSHSRSTSPARTPPREHWMTWYYREVEAERTVPFFSRPPTPFPRGAPPSSNAASGEATAEPAAGGGHTSAPGSSRGSQAGGGRRCPEYAECFMPLVADMSHSRRFAYALIDPPSHCPADLLCRAFEQRAGNPSIGLAASHYGAMMVIFSSEHARELALREFFPLPFDGHVIMLERPENGENYFGWEYTCFAQLSATGFPLEHWHEGGIRNALRSIGNV
ncbi:uncharacterized protein [Triticum aestivum]|uniref:uncharacterized protein n=1 Tax=Triticum aestivum TaxID=4565 RepID=UPI001D010C87|nr:uncharacterized protein LOC123104971 [Triticum aestivum]